MASDYELTRFGRYSGVPVEQVELQMERAAYRHGPYRGPAFTPDDAKVWYVKGLISLEEFERAIDITIERGWG